ncbi:MAG: ribonuclease HII [Nitrospinaceae bacterium]|nr:ribonuclease HII [Nitrospinaceae bacterium]
MYFNPAFERWVACWIWIHYALVMNLMEYETKAANQGFRNISGVDEAGRGPLAGPVVAAAVIFSPNIDIVDLDDSKKLSPKKREELFPEIQERATAYGVAVIGHKIIDEINILQAARLAMKQAVDQLNPIPDLLLIDGNQKIESSIDQWAIVKGDSKSLSIAAASVLAKVTRDRIMDDYHKLYPQYAFNRHKGYGTKLHRTLIQEYGPCPIHRSKFKGVSEYINR